MLSPKEVVNKWVDAFNASDVDMIVSLYDNNATNYQVANEPVVGVVAIREMFANEFSTAKMVRFLYKGIIINHNKKPSQPMKCYNKVVTEVANKI